jgi:putative sterol carrier protein
MADQFTYLSSEWRDEALRKLKSELTPDRMNNVTTSMTNIVNACPDGVERFLFIECKDGVVTRVETGTGEAPEAEFRIIGDYDVFSRISRAELGSQKALMTGKLKLKGNLAKALSLASVSDRLNKVLAQIPTRF